jgi:UDP:flavonoid glycosyltransferase YjiC (YdhE family)
VLFGLKFQEIVLLPIELEFSANFSFRERVHHFGGYCDLDRKENDFDWGKIKTDKKIIYCAIGTVVKSDLLIGFICRLMQVAKKLDHCEFVIAAGRVYDDVVKVKQGGNIHIFEFTPQLSVLQQCHLMITLGGANSIRECILSGVRMLCYPFHGDQFGNAARLSFHRLSLRGNILRDTSEDIANKILETLNDESLVERIAKFKNFFSFNDEKHFQLLQLIENELVSFDKKSSVGCR